MTKSLAALALCFSTLYATDALSGSDGAAVYKLTDEDMQIVSRSQDFIRGEAEQGDEPLPFKFDINLADFTNAEQLQKAQQEAKELAAQITEQRNKTPLLNADMEFEQNEQTPTPQPYKEHSTLVFASLSLGEQGLHDLLSMVSGMDEAVVVFRGIPRGESMTVALTRLQRIASQHDPMPALIINPDLFRSYNVTAVPTIVSVDTHDLPVGGDSATPVAKVAGISDPSWLNRAIERGETGDLGIKGPVLNISEVDLIELAKERVAEIDWEEKQKAAIANFWHNQKFTTLERAPRQRMKVFDPSVQITQDIQAPDGTYIARKGDIINPLKIRAFTQAVIVFDPTDKEQVELVLEAVPALKENPNIGFISYIATQIDPIEGWKSYEKITDIVDEHVTLLTPDVAQRFELEYVPSVITSGGDVFHITELARTE